MGRDQISAISDIGSVAAIVPAAGAGKRFGGRTQKALIQLNGRPLLIHALTALQRTPAIRWILVVVRKGDEARAQALLRRHAITKALPVCVGGSSRAESVARGFAQLPRTARWILVHDAARPCVSRRLIERAVRAAARDGAVACGLPAALTVKAVDEHQRVRLTLDRAQLWFLQTPQVFRRDWFASALAQADHALVQFPDDASIVEAAGFPVRMIPGDPWNIKVTTKDDLFLAKAILEQRQGAH